MLIAIEGVDKSGKETQSALLFSHLEHDGRNTRKIEFPDYKSEAAGAVRMYLGGRFGNRPDDVNPYAASTFFAVDRYASYKTDWGEFYNSGGVVVADRYTMSNMIHQGAKFSDESERRRFIDWLIDLEFVKIGLPAPDLVVFLDLPMDLRAKLINRHAVSASTAVAQPFRPGADIHERDLEYLNRSHVCAREIAERLGWTRINVERDGSLRPALEIHDEIYARVASFFTV